jgi:hypothetical protein
MSYSNILPVAYLKALLQEIRNKKCESEKEAEKPNEDTNTTD